MRLAFALLIALCLASCGRSEPETVWFVHATDPHLFDGEEEKDERDGTRKIVVQTYQEKLNQAAFADLLRAMGSLPGTAAEPEFLVVTGDFGIDRFFLKGVPVEEVKDAKETMAKLLLASPVRDVYFVPGNNDVAGESASAKDLRPTREFFGDVETLLGGRVDLHDLTSCYFAVSAPCKADIPDTDFRLIGFPSHSFKNKKPATFDANRALQEAQADRLAALVDQARRDGRKALILTHIAELDDPYTQAQERFSGVKRYDPSRTARPRWSAWNVSEKVFTRWKGIVDSRTVAGVLAGHFHDVHREIYYPPYRWSVASLNRADPDKLFLAPPLAARLQDTSPRQARGFSLIGLQGDDVTRRFFWYHPGRGIFQPDRKVQGGGQGNGFWSGTSSAALWIWDLAPDQSSLARMVVVAIALLAAFLTVAELWQVAPGNTRPVTAINQTRTETAQTQTQSQTSASPAQGSSATRTQQVTTYQTYGGMPLLFQSNFARTVLSGLAGLALVSTFDSLWKGDGFNEEPYYLVLFVVFFLVGLVLSGILRGITEVMRSRISLARRPPGRGKSRVVYMVKRFGAWLFSFRSAILVFLDTFSNVILGGNQLVSSAFEHEIADLHESIVTATDRVRKELDREFLVALRRRKDAHGRKDDKKQEENPTDPPGDQTSAGIWKLRMPTELDVRVNISLLSNDEKTVFYVSREEGSLAKAFGPRSMAWLSVFTGRALWWKKSYEGHEGQIVLMDNVSQNGGLLYPALPAAKLYLKDYFEFRNVSDYEAFIILPIPWGFRAGDDRYRRAAVHVSFSHAGYMAWLWDGLETETSDPSPTQGQRVPGATQASQTDSGQPEKIEPQYEDWHCLLHKDSDRKLQLRDPELAEAIHRAGLVLMELYQHFNDLVFEDYVRPRIRPQ